MGKKVLIVEDEQNIVDILSFNLVKEGYDIENIPVNESVMMQLYPEIYACIGCNACTKACTQGLNVMQYIAYAQRGDFEKCAEESFDCVMCGVCSSRCPAGISHPQVAMLPRRINGKHLQMLEGDRLSACAKNAEGETVEAECTVTDSADDHIDALLPAPFNDKALVNGEIVFKVEGRCGDPLAGTQTKTIAATLDDNDVPPPVVTNYVNQGREGNVTDANEIFYNAGDAIFSGSNLAGASVRITSDVNDSVIDIKSEKLTVTDTELRIAFDALEALFSAFGKDVDVNVNITTPGGTVTVKCRLVNDTVAG